MPGKGDTLKPGIAEWAFEDRESPLLATSMLLVRVIIGKVEDGNRLVEILRSTPTRQGQAGWNCVFRVKEALDALKADGNVLGTNVTEWEKIRSEASAFRC
ncbi:hypothetical protein N7524_003137 [Penicillium chrysogenum]|nr:hypothetical protein N7524_003137 [Penicillium chrysogenum]